MAIPNVIQKAKRIDLDYTVASQQIILETINEITAVFNPMRYTVRVWSPKPYKKLVPDSTANLL